MDKVFIMPYICRIIEWLILNINSDIQGWFILYVRFKKNDHEITAGIHET